jgi:cytochrome c peroxidase
MDLFQNKHLVHVVHTLLTAKQTNLREIEKRGMDMKKWTFIIIVMALIGILVFRFSTIEYAYTPPDERIANEQRNSHQIAAAASKAEAGTDKQIQLGKKMFFEETFGDEVFFTDIMGLFNGPFTLSEITKSLIKLGGKGTSNLRVKAAKSFHAGNITMKKGDFINTGLDVAKGSYVPLGLKVVFDEGRPKVGVSCAACHASVDEKGNVRAGAPNTDVNIGLTLAMGTNTASYFTHTEMKNLKDFINNSAGEKRNISLPDKKKLEKFVDSEIVKWPPGSNDTTIDFKNNPVQIPDTYTLGDEPYGWSGQGQIGPFKGLSAAINNAHAQNMDTLSQSEICGPVMKMNKDLYLGTILQNAANKKFRYDPMTGEKAGQFFAKVDPTPGVPGVNRLIPSATYPKISFLSSVGLLPGSSKYKVWEQIDAISAYMNSLKPASTGLKKESLLMEEGRRVFAKAGCISCHGGDYLTNNRVIGIDEIKTDPSRARGFKKTELYFADPIMFKTDTPVPLPKNPQKIDLKLSAERKNSLNMAWAHGDSKGGYKIPSLYGLNQSAPYLHDGGVAVGKGQELGVVNTLYKGIKPDPVNSLQALIDSGLRKQVIEANQTAPEVNSAHISGQGHEFWVDETTGFTQNQQKALLYYLLRVSDQ